MATSLIGFRGRVLLRSWTARNNPDPQDTIINKSQREDYRPRSASTADKRVCARTRPCRSVSTKYATPPRRAGRGPRRGFIMADQEIVRDVAYCPHCGNQSQQQVVTHYTRYSPPGPY